jgi:hypothetical protein
MPVGLVTGFTQTKSKPGLKVTVNGGTAVISGSVASFPIADITVPANALSYIYLNFTSGNIEQSTSGFLANAWPICTVQTNSTDVSTLTDMRPDVFGGGGSASSLQLTTAGAGFIFGGLPVGAIPANTQSGESFCANVANKVMMVQWVVECTITIRKMTVGVGVLDAGKHAFCGIYDSTGALLADLTSQASGSFSTSATGLITITLTTPYTLNPGVYYLGYSSDSTVAKVGLSYNLLVGPAPQQPVAFINQNVARFGFATNPVSAGAMPATLGALTASSSFWTGMFLFEP